MVSGCNMTVDIVRLFNSGWQKMAAWLRMTPIPAARPSNFCPQSAMQDMKKGYYNFDSQDETDHNTGMQNNTKIPKVTQSWMITYRSA